MYRLLLLMTMQTAWNVPGATSPKKKNTLDQHLSPTTQITASSNRPSWKV